MALGQLNKIAAIFESLCAAGEPLSSANRTGWSAAKQDFWGQEISLWALRRNFVKGYVKQTSHLSVLWR